MPRIRVPYFYVIRHVPSGKRYAGCRYSKNCHPDDLLTSYMTSSKVVKALLSRGDEFVIEQIVTDFGEHGNSSEFEDHFLSTNDCTGSNDWLNISRGNGIHHAEYQKRVNALGEDMKPMRQAMARKSAETMAANGIRKRASIKTADSRKAAGSYGQYEIIKPCGEVIHLNGNFQHYCFEVLGLNKTVFLQLRDEGVIQPRPNDHRVFARTIESEWNTNAKRCAEQRKQFTNWKLRKL